MVIRSYKNKDDTLGEIIKVDRGPIKVHDRGNTTVKFNLYGGLFE